MSYMTLTNPDSPLPLTAEDHIWQETCDVFLSSVPESLRARVATALMSLHSGGSGLRSWLAAITWRGGKLPEHIPAEIIQVYLSDEEATPLFDCEDCGMAIPVRPNRKATFEDEPEHIYFDSCPICGGRTGLYLYFSRQCQSPVKPLPSRSPGKPR